MDDLIRRQEAIEAVLNIVDTMSVCITKDECYGMRRMKERAIKELKELPSAEPELIYCKNCKHHRIYRCIDSMPQEICVLGQTFYDSEVDFCSLAEKKRIKEDFYG